MHVLQFNNCNLNGEQTTSELPAYETLDVVVAMKHRPCFIVRDKITTTYGRAGVWHHRIRQGQDGPEADDIYVCSPLHVIAVTCDEFGGNFGRLLRFRDSLGNWKEWAMPMAILAGNGTELRSVLLEMGGEPDPDARNSLQRYLQHKTPTKQILAATRLGWHDHGYLMPSCFISHPSNEVNVVLQDGLVQGGSLYEQAGDLTEWIDGVAALAIGNPMLTLSLSTAFAAPLVKLSGIGNGGIHFCGATSTGKTTINNAAASVWGNPKKGKQVKTWRATGNGIEGAAANANDNLLVLDEIAEICDPKELGAIIYALGNGSGKARASKNGSIRPPATFNLLFLSNGEVGKSTVFETAKLHAQAGMDVRMVELTVNRKFGAFDFLHCFDDGAELSSSINCICRSNFGLAGPAFLEKLVAQPELNVVQRHHDILTSFNAEAGAQGRVANLFSLIALGGELASEFGLTGWPAGSAINAAKLMFQEWCHTQPTGNPEASSILEAVRNFIERHGSGRFEKRNNEDGRLAIRERAGWFEETPRGRVYLLSTSGMKEALDGFDFRRGLDILETAGWLKGRDNHNPTYGKQVKIQNVNHRVFFIEVGDTPNTPALPNTHLSKPGNSITPPAATKNIDENQNRSHVTTVTTDNEILLPINGVNPF